MKELNRAAASELDDSSSLASPYMCHGLDPQYLTPGFIPLNHRSHQLSGLASFQSPNHIPSFLDEILQLAVNPHPSDHHHQH
ncbi:hypothetical protein F2Q69_00025602 [Brassica cretica]|uniref:Uncharacterized protein n=1 Tax=Brassica cretica TaxID=69181 RepID=A0A8S9S5V2_BRACR|nr:hypothetical protein F2Q69_00025602 [Brassica cretica]